MAEADCKTEGAKAVLVITGAPAAAVELIKGGLPWDCRSRKSIPAPVLKSCFL
jgi:hypothetical protein